MLSFFPNRFLLHRLWHIKVTWYRKPRLPLQRHKTSKQKASAFWQIYKVVQPEAGPFLWVEANDKASLVKIKSSDKEKSVTHDEGRWSIVLFWIYHIALPNRSKCLSCMDIFRQSESGHRIRYGSHFFTPFLTIRIDFFSFHALQIQAVRLSSEMAATISKCWAWTTIRCWSVPRITFII